jgi:excisionase family DNA binding protein
MTNRRRLDVDPADEKLGLPDAGRLLGVDQRTIRRYIAAGKLPAYRLAGGRVLRVRRGDVEALLTPLPTAGNVRAR